MKKDQFEKICRRIGLTEEAKIAVRRGEILVADGEPNEEGRAHLVKLGAVQIGQFPDGYYMTAWNMENKQYPITGKFLFFDKNHDKSFDEKTRKCLRVDAAIEDSIEVVEMLHANSG